MADGDGGAVYVDKLLKTIKERPWKDGKGFGMWVVQTFKNGRSERVKVVAGMYKTSAINPDEKILPKDGLELEHFEALRSIYLDEVEPLLKIPKGSPPQPDAPQQTPEPELPPWMK